LDFELRLACELSPADVLRMMRAPAGVPKSSGAPAVASPAVSPAEPVGVGRLLGPSAAMQSVCEAVRRFAALDAPVLITGETGTGKELVARALHDESPRSTQPFVAINCGAIAESLLESELFGHERGAFTGATQTRQGLFEQAGTGTILLDEIGDIPPRLQVALLRVLEVGEIRPVGGSKLRRVGCRILAATNAPLDRLVEEGRFRQDLLYRLKRLEIRLSPLRERREDILPLASHFLGEGRTDGRWPVLSPELREELSRREWPGNVRELKNVIELMRLLGSEKLAYEMADLEPETSAAAGDPGSSPAGEGRKPEAESRSSGESPKMKLAAVLAESRSPLRRLERLREAFRQSPTLTRQEVIRFLGISHATATHDLAMLSAEGLIEKVRPTPSPATHYFRLRPSGSAADRRLEAADAQEESTLAP
jgi:DNA-binding NtrC family response regulator